MRLPYNLWDLQSDSKLDWDFRAKNLVLEYKDRPTLDQAFHMVMHKPDQFEDVTVVGENSEVLDGAFELRGTAGASGSQTAKCGPGEVLHRSHDREHPQHPPKRRPKGKSPRRRKRALQRSH